MEASNSFPMSISLAASYFRMAGLSISFLIFTPSAAFAHASERGYVLLLPTGYYLVGGACAVIISFLALFLLPRNPLETLAAWRLPLFRVPTDLRLLTSAISFFVMLMLIAAGIFGSRDPLSNPLPLTVWTLIWIGITLIQGVIGNLWRWIDPWYAPVRLATSAIKLPNLPYPHRLYYWPALALFAGFVWFELIDLAPDDPYRLAIVVLAYWLVTFMAVLSFGYDTWSRHGEFLSVFLRFVSRFGIFERREAVGTSLVALCLPGAKLWAAKPLPLSGVLFLLAVLASVSFDGFSRTFFWLGANGINPLEFPGRSAMQTINATGLVLMFAALTCAFLVSVAIGRSIVGSVSLVHAAGLLVWSIVPIALAYHFAHYLTALLVNGQYALVALSDPFGLGWNLLGTAHMQVAAGVVMGSDNAWLVWNAQAIAIIGGHVVAVIVAHMLSFRAFGARSIAAELPLTLLMIGYTVFGLWLLSTPTAA
jgi:hypothetical protein